MPYRRDMYRFPRSRECNSNAWRGPHDKGVSVHRRFSNLGLAVVRWIFGPSREAFSEEVPQKKILFAGTLGVDPLPLGIVGFERKGGEVVEL